MFVVITSDDTTFRDEFAWRRGDVLHNHWLCPHKVEWGFWLKLLWCREIASSILSCFHITKFWTMKSCDDFFRQQTIVSLWNFGTYCNFMSSVCMYIKVLKRWDSLEIWLKYIFGLTHIVNRFSCWIQVVASLKLCFSKRAREIVITTTISLEPLSTTSRFVCTIFW